MNKTTEQRISEMKEEFSKPFRYEVLDTEGYSGWIEQEDISFCSLCEHHLVAFIGSATIRYVPKNKLICLSKMARLVEKYLNPVTPTIQERATKQIFDEFLKVVNPSKLVVEIKAQHQCISNRGVKKPSWTLTRLDNFTSP